MYVPCLVCGRAIFIHFDTNRVAETSSRVKLETELGVLKIEYESVLRRAELAEQRSKAAEVRHQQVGRLMLH